MEPMTTGEILAAVNGKLLSGSEGTVIGSVSTDTRSQKPGDLFLALKGERFDAHAFIAQAVAAGAAAVVASDWDPSCLPEEQRARTTWIQVSDTLRALQDLAAWHRRRFSIPVIGITGSVGKTSTKEMIADALSVKKNVLRTAGNLNNEIGLPHTLLRLDRTHEAAVIEMGAGGPGDIARLSCIAAPTHAVVTNIGVSHMEQFRTRENIRDEKLRITEGFEDGTGHLFLNGDDDMLWSVRDQLPGPCVWYGLGTACSYRGEDIRVGDGHTSFRMRHPAGTESVRLPVTGAHHVYNALAAAAVAASLGIAPADSIRGMLNYRGVALRQQIRKGNGLTVIDDSYNASPDSVKSGLGVLAALDIPGRRIAVLADMYELGSYAEHAHRDAGVAAVRSGVDELIAIGGMAGWIRDGVHEEGNTDLPVQVFDTLEDAYAYLQDTVREGDGLYVKGSRSMHCDRLARALVGGDWDEDAPH